MFCSNCGRKAGGNFCSGCGAKLAASESPDILDALPAEEEPPSVVRVVVADWRREVRYAELIRHPVVRDRIASAAASAPKAVPLDKIMNVYDKVAKPVVPSNLLIEVVPKLWAGVGVGSGKRKSARFRSPPGAVIASALCSLARHGLAVGAVSQHADGCAVTAKMTADLFAYEGELTASFRRDPAGTFVEAEAKIPGQFVDWGKCQARLDRLFAETFEGLRDDAVRAAV